MKTLQRPTLWLLPALAVFSSCKEDKHSATTTESMQQASEAGKPDYHCPMHPHVHSDKPGECPICHMALVRSTNSQPSAPSQPENQQNRKIKFYRNPMNPAITSPVPTKDDMGMDYIPVFEDSQNEGAKNESDVPGRGLVTLNSAQMDLAGLRLAKVTRNNLTLSLRSPGRAISPSAVSFQVFEEDLADIKVGQTFTATSPSLPGRTLRGRITSIDSFLDPMTRTARVSGNLNSGSPTLRVEASIVGSLETQLNQVLTVPEEAVLHTGEHDIVYVAESERTFRPQHVQLGHKAEGQYEVLQGLSEGQTVSAGPNFLLDSEARVRAAQ